MKQALSCLKNGMVALAFIGSTFLHGANPTNKIGPNWNLPHLHNTCYQASVIQALSACPDIIKKLEDTNDKNNIQKALLNVIKAIKGDIYPGQDENSNGWNLMNAFVQSLDKEWQTGKEKDAPSFFEDLRSKAELQTGTIFSKQDISYIVNTKKISTPIYIPQSYAFLTNSIPSEKSILIPDIESPSTIIINPNENQEIITKDNIKLANSRYELTAFVAGDTVHMWCWLKHENNWYKYDDLRDNMPHSAAMQLAQKPLENSIRLCFYTCTEYKQEQIPILLKKSKDIAPILLKVNSDKDEITSFENFKNDFSTSVIPTLQEDVISLHFNILARFATFLINNSYINGNEKKILADILAQKLNEDKINVLFAWAIAEKKIQLTKFLLMAPTTQVPSEVNNKATPDYFTDEELKKTLQERLAAQAKNLIHAKPAKAHQDPLRKALQLLKLKLLQLARKLIV